MSNCILLIEDNDDDVFAFQRALAKARIQTALHVATDGKEALEYLQNAIESTIPLIVFLDLKLPYVNGFQILRWIRDQRSYDNVIVVILTSSAEVKDKQQAYTLGARSYLVKPPTDKDIRDVIDSLQIFWSSKGIASPLSNPPGA